MLAIHKPKSKPIKYCLYEDGKYFKGKMIELPDGYQFHHFSKSDNSVLKCYINSHEYIILSVYDTCWLGKNPIPRDIIPERIEVFTEGNKPL